MKQTTTTLIFVVFLQMVSQLKLSLAQLISLRVQHGRSPAEKLRRMIQGDHKAIISSGYAVCIVVVDDGVML